MELRRPQHARPPNQSLTPLRAATTEDEAAVHTNEAEADAPRGQETGAPTAPELLAVWDSDNMEERGWSDGGSDSGSGGVSDLEGGGCAGDSDDFEGGSGSRVGGSYKRGSTGGDVDTSTRCVRARMECSVRSLTRRGNNTGGDGAADAEDAGEAASGEEGENPLSGYRPEGKLERTRHRMPQCPTQRVASSSEIDTSEAQPLSRTTMERSQQQCSCLSRRRPQPQRWVTRADRCFVLVDEVGARELPATLLEPTPDSDANVIQTTRHVPPPQQQQPAPLLLQQAPSPSSHHSYSAVSGSTTQLPPPPPPLPQLAPQPTFCVWARHVLPPLGLLPSATESLRTPQSPPQWQPRGGTWSLLADLPCIEHVFGQWHAHRRAPDSTSCAHANDQIDSGDSEDKGAYYERAAPVRLAPGLTGLSFPEGSFVTSEWAEGELWLGGRGRLVGKEADGNMAVTAVAILPSVAHEIARTRAREATTSSTASTRVSAGRSGGMQRCRGVVMRNTGDLVRLHVVCGRALSYAPLLISLLSSEDGSTLTLLFTLFPCPFLNSQPAISSTRADAIIESKYAACAYSVKPSKVPSFALLQMPTLPYCHRLPVPFVHVVLSRQARPTRYRHLLLR